MLNHKVIIVTGGGAGIGESVSKHLAADDAKVDVADINKEAVKAVANAIKAVERDAFAVAVDIADEESVKAMVNAAVAHYDRLDGAVNSPAEACKRRYLPPTAPCESCQPRSGMNRPGS